MKEWRVSVLRETFCPKGVLLEGPEIKTGDFVVSKDAYLAKCEEVTALEANVELLQREIYFLRQYGNKDCTAMADEALKEYAAEKGEER